MGMYTLSSTICAYIQRARYTSAVRSMRIVYALMQMNTARTAYKNSVARMTLQRWARAATARHATRRAQSARFLACVISRCGARNVHSNMVGATRAVQAALRMTRNNRLFGACKVATWLLQRAWRCRLARVVMADAREDIARTVDTRLRDRERRYNKLVLGLSLSDDEETLASANMGMDECANTTKALERGSSESEVSENGAETDSMSLRCAKMDAGQVDRIKSDECSDASPRRNSGSHVDDGSGGSLAAKYAHKDVVDSSSSERHKDVLEMDSMSAKHIPHDKVDSGSDRHKDVSLDGGSVSARNMHMENKVDSRSRHRDALLGVRAAADTRIECVTYIGSDGVTYADREAVAQPHAEKRTRSTHGAGKVGDMRRIGLRANNDRIGKQGEKMLQALTTGTFVESVKSGLVGREGVTSAHQNSLRGEVVGRKRVVERIAAVSAYRSTHHAWSEHSDSDTARMQAHTRGADGHQDQERELIESMAEDSRRLALLARGGRVRPASARMATAVYSSNLHGTVSKPLRPASARLAGRPAPSQARTAVEDNNALENGGGESSIRRKLRIAEMRALSNMQNQNQDAHDAGLHATGVDTHEGSPNLSAVVKDNAARTGRALWRPKAAGGSAITRPSHVGTKTRAFGELDLWTVMVDGPAVGEEDGPVGADVIVPGHNQGMGMRPGSGRNGRVCADDAVDMRDRTVWRRRDGGIGACHVDDECIGNGSKAGADRGMPSREPRIVSSEFDEQTQTQNLAARRARRTISSRCEGGGGPDRDGSGRENDR
jgi:hypothetical protein